MDRSKRRFLQTRSTRLVPGSQRTNCQVDPSGSSKSGKRTWTHADRSWNTVDSHPAERWVLHSPVAHTRLCSPSQRILLRRTSPLRMNVFLPCVEAFMSTLTYDKRADLAGPGIGDYKELER